MTLESKLKDEIKYMLKLHNVNDGCWKLIKALLNREKLSVKEMEILKAALADFRLCAVELKRSIAYAAEIRETLHKSNVWFRRNAKN